MRSRSSLPARLAVLGVLLALSLLTAAGASAATTPAALDAAQSARTILPPTQVSSDPTATAAAACDALILNRNRQLVTLRITSYRYKFVKLAGGQFKRTVKKVRVAVKVSCVNQCVKVVKKRGKYSNVYRVKLVRRKFKRGNTIVTRKVRARVYSFTECKNLPSAEELGTPVKVTVQPGSYALLDFGSFTRQVGVTGVLRGFIPGAFKPNTDVQVTFTKGELALAKTPVFIDDACNNQVSSSLRTGTPSRVLLDPTKTSSTTLLASGTVTAIVYTKILLPLELRNEDTGCNDPYITTGYSEFLQTFFIRGKVGAGGLLKLPVSSSPDTLEVIACLSPGIPTQPCNGFQVPIPILVSTKLTVSIDLSGKN